jgi:hypothetical protein
MKAPAHERKIDLQACKNSCFQQLLLSTDTDISVLFDCRIPRCFSLIRNCLAHSLGDSLIPFLQKKCDFIQIFLASFKYSHRTGWDFHALFLTASFLSSLGGIVLPRALARVDSVGAAAEVSPRLSDGVAAGDSCLPCKELCLALCILPRVQRKHESVWLLRMPSFCGHVARVAQKRSVQAFGDLPAVNAGYQRR